MGEKEERERAEMVERENREREKRSFLYGNSMRGEICRIQEWWKRKNET